MAELLTHPARAEMEAFALGTLDDSRTPEIEEHLANCPECQEYAASVPGDTFVSMLAAAKTTLEEKRPILALVPAEPPAELVAHSRYRPLGLLGVGGMGTVWLAEHALMGRQVAIKVIRPEFLAKPGAVGRFRREVAAAAKLHHPNIVTAFDAEQAGGTHFLAMEYVDGIGLDDLLKEKGALPIADACRHIADAARGLDHAHRLNLVHRDVKPSNLMRAADGTVKVLDFGLAMIVADDRADTTITGANMVVGTPDYIAPEQAEHPQAADGRADIYALGCTAYQLLTGQVPFPGVSVLQKLDAQRRERPKPLNSFRSDIPPELEKIVMKMLEKKPADRYQTAAEVVQALAPFTDPAYVAQRNRPRYRRLAAVAASFLFVFLLAAGAVYRIQTDKGDLVISTDSDDVEVVVKQAGKLVTIIDTKTQKRIELKSGEYELELKGAEGLKLNVTKATLTRGDTVLATIERVDRKVATAAVEAPAVPVPPITTDEPVERPVRPGSPAGRGGRLADGTAPKKSAGKGPGLTGGLGTPQPDVGAPAVGRPGAPKPAEVWPPAELPAVGFMSRLPIQISEQFPVFSPDNRLIAFHNQASSSIVILESATGRVVNRLPLGISLSAFAFTHDSKRIIAMKGQGGPFVSIEDWDIATTEKASLVQTIRLNNVKRIYTSARGKRPLIEFQPQHGGDMTFAVFDMSRGEIINQHQVTSGMRRYVSADRTRAFTLLRRTQQGGFDKSGVASKPVTVTLLRIDELTNSDENFVEKQVSDDVFAIWESPDRKTVGVVAEKGPGKLATTTYDSHTLATLPTREQKDLPSGLKKSMVTIQAGRAIVKTAAGFEVVDLADDFKRHPIALLPNHDAMALSDDGQVFGARTETGWNLYRLPEVSHSPPSKTEILPQPRTKP